MQPFREKNTAMLEGTINKNGELEITSAFFLLKARERLTMLA